MGGISEMGGTTSKLTEGVEGGFGGRPTARRALGRREVGGTGQRRVVFTEEGISGGRRIAREVSRDTYLCWLEGRLAWIRERWHLVEAYRGWRRQAVNF
jgi:hypothetical protein